MLLAVSLVTSSNLAPHSSAVGTPCNAPRGHPNRCADIYNGISYLITHLPPSCGYVK